MECLTGQARRVRTASCLLENPEPWEGIRPAVFWGDTAPQRPKGKYRNSYSTLVDHWNYYDVSEDCLMLNIWTPGLTDNKKRPVLVWLHGGGLPTVMVLNKMVIMAKISAVMVTSFRIHQSSFGAYRVFRSFRWPVRDSKHRGNVGILDRRRLEMGTITQSNLAKDPDNVTIIGQCGRWFPKCCTLVAMPETQLSTRP